MRLTTFTDYSLRVLMYLAVRPEGRSTIAGIATAFNISENHLTKVVHFLGREGYLVNTRGRGGDVPAECFEPRTNRCSITQDCLLKLALAESVKAFYATLGKHTLADVVKNREALAKVLFPAPVAAPAARRHS